MIINSARCLQGFVEASSIGPECARFFRAPQRMEWHARASLWQQQAIQLDYQL